MDDAEPRTTAFVSFTRSAARELMQRRGAVTRRELGEVLGLSRTGVTSLVDQLVGEGVVEEVPDARPSGRPGRPSRVLRLATDGSAILVLAVRPRAIEVAVVVGGAVTQHRAAAMGLEADASGVLDALVELSRQAVGESGAAPVCAVLALPTMVHSSGRIDHHGARELMSSWLEIDVSGHLAGCLGVPVSIVNETVASAAGVIPLPGEPAPRCALYVKVGASGTGMCALIEGRPFSGESGIAGQLGHISIRGHGVRCPCGQRGCIAAEIDAQVREEIERRRASLPKYSVDSLVAESIAGDPATRRFFYDLGIQLAPALGAAINLFQPSLVVVGGDLAHGDTGILAGLEAELSLSVHPGVAVGMAITSSSVGREATLLGAAVLAREGRARA